MMEVSQSLSDLVRRWQLGEGLSRGFHPTSEARGGLHVPLGQSDQQHEITALYADDDLESVRLLAAEVANAQHLNWLAVPTTHPEVVGPILRGAGLDLRDQADWLMTCDLQQHPLRVPTSQYVCEIISEGPVIKAQVRHSSGVVAAKGSMVVVNTDAIADRIVTIPEHRRLGLGSVVMSVLVQQAIVHGATTGILIASPDGQQLYPTLGWIYRATVYIGQTPNHAAQSRA